MLVIDELSRGIQVQIERPIFIIGTGRCGSTIIFEALALHEGLAWFSSYNERFPEAELASIMPRLYDVSFIPRGEKRQFKQGRLLLNRFLPKPAECYRKWAVMCGQKFAREYLIGVKAAPEEAFRVLRAVKAALSLQGKRRFLNKITGPSRIGYLQSIFPDALFVHVVRDGRAVVNSLLGVDYWREGGGLERPYWETGLPEKWREEWMNYGSTPATLAAMQLRAILKVCEEERRLLGENQYLKVAYEDFIEDPKAVITCVLEFCGLEESRRLSSYLNQLDDDKYVSMNKKYLERFSEAELESIDRILGYE